MKYKFEEKIIDVILTVIKDNQVYLTQKENLPQLAKLGYMYNTLWYAGRVCWGYDGLLLSKDVKNIIKGVIKGEYSGKDYNEIEEEEAYSYTSCEDNPKYKIEMCEPENEDIKNYIYDAWGMHVSDMETPISFESFVKLIKEGKPLSDLEAKLLKPNKTFEEWVEILTNPDHKYSSLYPDRKSVANQLLCTLGGGYGINKEGFIYEEASGADQDSTDYGDWKNTILRDDIAKIIYELLEIPELKLTLDTYNNYITEINKKTQKEEDKRNKHFYELLLESGLYEKSEGSLNATELHKRLNTFFIQKGIREDEENSYHAYYPISYKYAHITAIVDKEFRERLGIDKLHESYENAAIEVCKDILAHQKEENKDGRSNVKFAKKLLLQMGYAEYAKDVPKEIDKYELNKQVIELLSPLTSGLKKAKEIQNLKVGSYFYNFNNSKNNDYADDCYYLTASIDSTNLPKGLFNNITAIKKLPFYKELKDNISIIKKLDGIFCVDFYFNNSEVTKELGIINIKVSVNSEYNSTNIPFENKLIKKGFQIGKYNALFEIGDITLVTSKPVNLGKKHPHNKTGDECFSLNKTFDVYQSTNHICEFWIDERNFNTLRVGKGSNHKVAKWIKDEFINMKKSNPDYGYGKKEGKECLYAHDLFIWLKTNQSNLD